MMTQPSRTAIGVQAHAKEKQHLHFMYEYSTHVATQIARGHPKEVATVNPRPAWPSSWGLACFCKNLSYFCTGMPLDKQYKMPTILHSFPETVYAHATRWLLLKVEDILLAPEVDREHGRDGAEADDDAPHIVQVVDVCNGQQKVP